MYDNNEIMNEVEWRDDGAKGCLMSIVKIGAATLVLAVVTAVAFAYGAPALVNLWW